MRARQSFVAVILVLAAMVSLCACSSDPDNDGENWGSFTPDKTYSYDEKYYALQSVVEGEEARMIRVSVYLADADQLVAEFEPARAWDFWGICWERDTYHIWTQSSDIGIRCYAYQDGVWALDEDSDRPSYIRSRYDT